MKDAIRVLLAKAITRVAFVVAPKKHQREAKALTKAAKVFIESHGLPGNIRILYGYRDKHKPTSNPPRYKGDFFSN